MGENIFVRGVLLAGDPPGRPYRGNFFMRAQGFEPLRGNRIYVCIERAGLPACATGVRGNDSDWDFVNFISLEKKYLQL